MKKAVESMKGLLVSLGIAILCFVTAVSLNLFVI